jgi:peptidyl-tRNA hydrolase
MEGEQMLELLKAVQQGMETQTGSPTSKMDYNQAGMKAMQEQMDANMKMNQEMLARMEPKMDITLKEMKEEMMAKMEAMIQDNNEKFKVFQGTLVSQIDANHEEMKPIVNTHQEKMDAWIANMRDDRKERMAHQAKEANPGKLEPIPEEMEYTAEHREVPKEEGTGKTSRAMRKRHRGQHQAAVTAPFTDEDKFKLVLVVRTDLKMEKGEAAAQCSHAAVMAYEKALHQQPTVLKRWQACDQAKVVLKVETERELLELAHKAHSQGLIISLVCDAGRTQVAPGSETVLGIGPGPVNLVDTVSGHLKLF